MLDIGLVGLTVIFFALCWAFASLCERVRDPGQDVS